MKITLLLNAIFPLSAAFTVPLVALSHNKMQRAALYSSPESDVGSFSSEIPLPVIDSSIPGQSVISESSKQAEYGVSLDFPDSYAKCGRCQTIYGLTLEDLGDERSKGRRLECTVCGHTWFQSKDRLMFKKEGFEMVTLPDHDVERIKLNLVEGKAANFQGDSKLYVGNVSFECSANDLMEVFGEIGPVGDVSMVLDETGRSRGFAFVTMRCKEDGQKAIDALDGKDVYGRGIAVRESNN